MDKNDILKGIYEDFFGINKLSKENQKLAKEIEDLNQEFPKIEVKPIQKEELSKEQKDEKMKEIFDKIDNLYIDDKSKDTLKKISEYVRKYNEKIENKYISFDMCIYTNNKETVDIVTNILNELFNLFSYTNEGNIKEISLYDIEKTEAIDEIYKFQNNVILLKDFEAISNKDNSYKDKFLYKLNENLCKFEGEKVTVLYSKNKERIEDLFAKNDELRNRFFDFEIIGINPDVQDVYEEVLKKLSENMEVSEELQIKLLDYIFSTYPNNSLSFPQYRDELYEKIIFNKDVPEYEKDKTMEEIFAELNELVGLDKVKTMLRELVSLIELKEKTKDDLKLKNINLHMVFLGNPGTGKTTVARIVAQVLYNLKYIKQNKLIEVSSKDLVAEYVGQTAPKTMAVVEKAIRRSAFCG
ncbi:MAG: AAA family ATPase [Clostridia bacterium]|nr:AAA family ATPase [Clostridia bacterium]